MWTADFDYELPETLIAQRPTDRRDASRLLVLRREGGPLGHRTFAELPQMLREGDLLVLNDSKVMRARLRAWNVQTGGSFEMLLLEEQAGNEWWVMMRPAKRARVGARLRLADRWGRRSDWEADVREINEEGHRRLVFHGPGTLRAHLETLGEIPLPPYIRRAVGERDDALDAERYQTIYGRVSGSVAAPTAGLHFTLDLLEALRGMGVGVCWVTLHVGLGTFAPVKAERVAEHHMHEEAYEVPPETVRAVERARMGGGRVVAVGTTSVRVLESVAAAHEGRLVAGAGRTRIFIHPPYTFRVVDGLVTNFHLPRSTLLMLVSALAAPGTEAGRERILAAYAEAVRERYRFFSYGDAMLIL